MNEYRKDITSINFCVSDYFVPIALYFDEQYFIINNGVYYVYDLITIPQWCTKLTLFCAGHEAFKIHQQESIEQYSFV